ncbi:F-box/leucine rich repeat protein, putative [Entamoeba invadens IP1]|uniref:F-box/leucine rich repeat protein, putative n=1 Tax=Entamoeba invadens IP1 TaxID=370355 RepID=A0A0A1U1H0_ENTIV|nr:F-box/leucine rich repeat protein, putative [Entamoeba invadens IP1]ELP84753.1 F-box/leucine rich repeat protein, putative [Entamoeba invadens IP1]|eukprot:XP_004184099.1 F-box/leucine rich repeat protein, putative [Entamoeba invadens IP1]
MFSWLRGSQQNKENTTKTPQNMAVEKGVAENPIELTTYHENCTVNNIEEKDFHRIFKYLSVHDLVNCRLVCRMWKDMTKSISELVVTEPNPKLSLLFRDVKKLTVDPLATMDCAGLVTRLINLTSLKCGKINQACLEQQIQLKQLECPGVVPPFGVESICTNNMEKLGMYNSLTALELVNVSDKEITSFVKLGRLTSLRKLSIASKNFVGKIETFVDISHLTSLEISDAPLGSEFFYNLYLFPYLVFIGFTRCQLPVSGISPQTPLSQLSTTDGFIYIVGCNSLRYLYLNESQVSNYHLDVIARMENLIGLSLKGCASVNDYSLNAFKNGPISYSLEELNVEDTMITHIGLQTISRIKYLRVLDISRCIGIKIISPLNSLKNLEILRMTGIAVNAETIKDSFREPPKYLQQFLFESQPIDDPILTVFCSKFPTLEYLCLKGSKITSFGIQDLVILSHIRVLDISNTAVDDKCFEFISKLTYLEALYLEKCMKISGEGINVLSTLGSLRVLNMNGCAEVVIDSLKEMGELSVETLRLNGCNKIGGKFVWKYLSEIEHLKRLDLSNTSVDDDGVEEMVNCKWLEVLYLIRTKVSDKAITSLLKCNLLRKIDVRESNVVNDFLSNCIVITKSPERVAENPLLVVKDVPIENNKEDKESDDESSSSSESSEDSDDIPVKPAKIEKVEKTDNMESI